MNRSFHFAIAIATIAIGLSPPRLRADPPDVIGSYRFAPRISTIHPSEVPAMS